jgi:competence protein ComEC
VLAVLLLNEVARRWRLAALFGGGWLCVGLLAGAARLPSDELRCTFLSVGHGGCVVMEMPDGRTILYDAGALAGPEVTRRRIAPFLWHRGVRRIDEVILSHADLDHYNALPALLERFTVGQITTTPTFSDKNNPMVEFVLAAIEQRGVRRRQVRAGDRLNAGEVTMEVLHPSAAGPEGPENVRSLVLRIQHAGRTLLLTGDLEGAGLAQLLRQPSRPVDVLMAPHHGSPAANTPDLAAWTKPRVVISSQGAPRSASNRVADLYQERGARYLSTWTEGAVTVRSHATGLIVETFKPRQRFAVRH